MKNTKLIKKLGAIALATMMCVTVTACGGSSDKDSTKTTENNSATDETTDGSDTAKETGTSDNNADTGTVDTDTADMSDTDGLWDTSDTTASDFTMDGAEVKEWGDYTVSVPSGWTFKEGDTFDEADTRYCSVCKNDLYSIDLKMDESEENIMNHYNYNKETYTNEQKDVSGTYGDISWTGFQYSDGFGGYGCELYTTIGKKYVRISATFGFDSPEVKGVLESLKIKE